MVKFITPTGTGEALTQEDAEEICRQAAEEESESNGTGLYQALRYNGITTFITGSSKWIIEGKSQSNYL